MQWTSFVFQLCIGSPSSGNRNSNFPGGTSLPLPGPYFSWTGEYNQRGSLTLKMLARIPKKRHLSTGPDLGIVHMQRPCCRAKREKGDLKEEIRDTVSSGSAMSGHHRLFQCCVMLCLVAQLCLTLCDPMNCSPPGSSVHGDSPGKNIGVGCHALLQGIFPTQGSNPGLLHCRQILYHLSHQKSRVLCRESIHIDPII